MIRVAIPGAGDEARPVPIAIFHHQQIVGLADSGRAAEDAIDVDGCSPGRPGTKRGAAVNEICPYRSRWQDVGLRNHDKSSLHLEFSLRSLIPVEFGERILYPRLARYFTK